MFAKFGLWSFNVMNGSSSAIVSSLSSISSSSEIAFVSLFISRTHTVWLSCMIA